MEATQEKLSGMRGNCFSITINNPTEADKKPLMPAGWTIEGQQEVGKNGTPHLQLMLKTSATERGSAVKKVFPRAHIEKAKSEKALTKYVHKEDTRVDEFRTHSVPSIFQYQKTIASKWDQHVFETVICAEPKQLRGSLAPTHVPIQDRVMEYVDLLVSQEIEAGQEGAEWISINPMWICSWRKHWKSIIKREQQKIRNEATIPSGVVQDFAQQ